MNEELLLERERTIKRLQEKFGLSEDQIIRSEDVEASGEKYLTFDGPNAVKYWNDLKELCEKEFGPQETQ